MIMSKRQFPCSSCGADLLFAPGSMQMECPYCGDHNELPEPVAEVEEQDYFRQMRKLEEQPDAADLVKVKEVTCGACGATTTVGVQVQADSCPFCDTAFVAEPHSEHILKPHAVLPFAITSNEGVQAFGKWVASLWFAPNKLKEYARRTEKLQGVYLAHWTYDARAYTEYTGERGDYYWDTEYYTDSDGKRQSRRVRKTRWWPASGSVVNCFDDILVVANDSLPRKYTEKLEPWDLDALAPFTEEYLAGFKAEHYSLGLRDGFSCAKEQVSPIIDRSICHDIGGDTQRIHHRVSDWHEVTFKHILLPVWVSAYRFNDTLYRVVINARTGEVQGERPYSVVKIMLAVLALVAVIAIIAIASRH
jgi:hypothetical protein